MPSKIVIDLISKVEKFEKSLTDHLIDSGRIQARLDFNTWLTGVILIALLSKFIFEWVKK